MAIIDWKRVFIRGLRTREKNSFFDLLIRRTSDLTLFNISMSQLPEDIVACPQCQKEKEEQDESTFVSSIHGSSFRLHSILWDDGFSSGSPGRSEFLKHNLKLGCIWAESPRVKVPKEFLLDYHTFTKTNNPIDINMSNLKLGSSPQL